MKLITSFAVVLTFGFLVSSCGSRDESSVTVEANFSSLNTHIFQAMCVSCHQSGNASGGVRLDSFAEVSKWVTAGNGTNSEIYKEVLDDSMPPSGTKLSTAQKDAIKAWIDSGAAEQ